MCRGHSRQVCGRAVCSVESDHYRPPANPDQTAKETEDLVDRWRRGELDLGEFKNILRSITVRMGD